MKICSTHLDTDWNALRPKLNMGDVEAWEEAVIILERRMNERFFNCIDLLVKAGKDDLQKQFETGCATITAGFSIMALCCILVETLEAFYEGHIMEPPLIPDHPCEYPRGACLRTPQLQETTDPCHWPDEGPCVRTPPTARSFTQFLKNSPHFKDFTGKARNSFSQQIRNGLLHDAETRGGWLIRMCEPSDRIVERRGDKYLLNRTKFYEALKAEFDDYLGRLKNPENATLRSNFLKKMDNICQYEPTVQG